MVQKKDPSRKKKGQKKDKESKDDKAESTTRSLKIGLASVVLSIVVAAISIIAKNVLSQKSLEIPDTPVSNNNQVAWELTQPRLGFFLSRACQVAYCHESLKASHRTFRAKSLIEAGEKLFDVPRSLQIWDLDALRDPFIRKHLFSASHKSTGNHLGNEAFLAAYLALQKDDVENGDTSIDPLRIAYIDLLPKLEEFSYHPLLAKKSEMKQMLGHSSAFSVLESYQEMMGSEYEAFANVSPEFADRISRRDYFGARLNVLTRAFRVGPPSANEAIPGNFESSPFKDQNLLMDELQAYKDLLGLDLMDESKGCIAMIPIADMFHHHPANNVELDYNDEGNGSFVLTVNNRTIAEGFEPMINYGTMADSQMFARYGFVNGDGSGHTQLSMAHHHAVLKLNISSQYDYLPHKGTTRKFIEAQRRPLANYINFDDGYENCIPGPTSHPEEAHFKALKHKHLIRIANDVEKWITLMPPRNPYSIPAQVITRPITLTAPHFIKAFTIENYNIDKLQETCRLISLTNYDLDGKATQLLEENLDNDSFVIGKGNDDLEFRSLFCVGRWIGTNLIALEREGDVVSLRQRVEELNRNAFGTLKWAALHVRYGEMQALQALGSLIVERVNSEWQNEKFETQAIFNVRDNACPDANVEYLFKDEKQDTLTDF